MKFSHLILLTCLTACMTIVACKDSAEESKNETPTSASPNANEGDNSGIMNPTTPAGNQAVNNPTAINGEPHYKCQTAGCTGNALAQGNCPICGAELVHNQAYHNQSGSGTPGTSPSTPVMIDPATGQPATDQQMTPPPAKNAAGEYHYTCPAGHAGAGAAGNCSTCGAALSHNAAYHNK